jgi:hypothetical protein
VLEPGVRERAECRCASRCGALRLRGSLRARLSALGFNTLDQRHDPPTTLERGQVLGRRSPGAQPPGPGAVGHHPGLCSKPAADALAVGTPPLDRPHGLWSSPAFVDT